MTALRNAVVYRTTDYGKTWKAITNGLPRNNLSYAKVIQEDPKRRGMLYLGLENGIYLSYDAGESWLPLQNDLPAAPVSGIQVQEHFNDLVISTYGRGFYILDDLGPLQQLTPEVMSSAAHLFEPRNFGGDRIFRTCGVCLACASPTTTGTDFSEPMPCSIMFMAHTRAVACTSS